MSSTCICGHSEKRHFPVDRGGQWCQGTRDTVCGCRSYAPRKPREKPRKEKAGRPRAFRYKGVTLAKVVKGSVVTTIVEIHDADAAIDLSIWLRDYAEWRLSL